MLRYLENDDLGGVSAFTTIGNAEEMAMPAHLYQPDSDRGHNAQVTGDFFGVLVRLNGIVWNGQLIPCVFKCQGRFRRGVELADYPRIYVRDRATDVYRVAIIDGGR